MAVSQAVLPVERSEIPLGQSSRRAYPGKPGTGQPRDIHAPGESVPQGNAKKTADSAAFPRDLAGNLRADARYREKLAARRKTSCGNVSCTVGMFPLH